MWGTDGDMRVLGGFTLPEGMLHAEETEWGMGNGEWGMGGLSPALRRPSARVLLGVLLGSTSAGSKGRRIPDGD